MKQITRRGFIRTGIAGAGAVAMSPIAAAVPLSEQKNIIYRTLGKTGLKVPVVSFGVMRSDNSSLCRAAHEKGMRLFDTANGYLGGNSEIMLGNLFKDYPRDSFIISTKVKPGTDNNGKPNAQTTLRNSWNFSMLVCQGLRWIMSISCMFTMFQILNCLITSQLLML